MQWYENEVQQLREEIDKLRAALADVRGAELAEKDRMLRAQRIEIDRLCEIIDQMQERRKICFKCGLHWDDPTGEIPCPRCASAKADPPAPAAIVTKYDDLIGKIHHGFEDQKEAKEFAWPRSPIQYVERWIWHPKQPESPRA